MRFPNFHLSSSSSLVISSSLLFFLSLFIIYPTSQSYNIIIPLSKVPFYNIDKKSSTYKKRRKGLQYYYNDNNNIFRIRTSTTTSSTCRNTHSALYMNNINNNNNNKGTTPTTTNNNNNNNNNKNPKKKRRFAQDVEPIVSIKAPTPKPKFLNSPRHDALNTNNNNSNNNDNSNSKDFSSRGSNKKGGPILQNTKSIEELESIMSNRWGSRLEKWSTDFDEWEVVYDDEDGGGKGRNDRNNNDHNNEFNQNNISIKSGKKVRSKPVLNPWDKEERQKIFEEKRSGDKKSKKDEYDQDNNASVFKAAKDRNDSVLERVRKNQERLRRQKNGKYERGGKKQINDDSYELEFYDEDDEGYEGNRFFDNIYNDKDGDLESEAMDFYDNIISPKPVGGSGSSQGFQLTDTSNDRGGFFFKEPSIDMSANEQKYNKKEPEKKVKKESPKKVVRQPILDDQGRKMYLSLDQASRNAELYVSSDGASNDDPEGNFIDNESSWEDIGITNPILLNNLYRMNCASPLSVQDKACPSIVSGNDVLISTHTGSGKTLAFLAPLAQRLLFDDENEEEGNTNQGVQVIIVAPGRELASQIVAVARELFQDTGLTAMLAIGGTPFSRNFEQIRKQKPTFLIGTPGRIAELVVGQPGDKRGKLKIASAKAIVLDECDALLEYEAHKEPTAALMETLQRRHRDSLQSILCSATAGDLMATSKIDGYLRESFAHAQSDEDDQSITAVSNHGSFSRTRVSRTAIHGVIQVPHRRFAIDMLRKILYTDPSPQQVLIFVDNARRVGIVVEKLAEMDIIAAPLHGGQGSEKGDRAEVNKALRDGFVGIVVATEMAARGIDAPYLTHVINLDLPTDASHYAHRAGRCGRGGRPGVVVNIAVGKKEQNVPTKFAKALNIDMYEAEPQGGKLVIVDSKQSPKGEKEGI